MKSDRQVQADVLEQLKFDPSIDANRIGVSVDHGVVTLSGTVSSYPEKYLAEKRAFTVAGVSSVVEKIEVILPEDHRRSDFDIAKSIAETLQWHVRIPTGVKAVVENGIVELRGEVSKEYQRDAAQLAAQNTMGVKAVRNHIHLRNGGAGCEIGH